MKLIAGNSNRPLAEKVANFLEVPLLKANIGRYADMEVFVELEESLRGEDVFLIQSLSYPSSDYIMEMLVTLDALKRGSARRVTAVIPYLCYARQDRRVSKRTAISGKLMADLITKAGADRVLVMDLHAPQIQGFFDIPVDHLSAKPVFVDHIKQHFDLADGSDYVVVSPDVGGIMRARTVAQALDLDLAVIDKRRQTPTSCHMHHVIGDVSEKTCLLIDDMVDSANTLCQASEALKKAGAHNIYAYVTHGVLSGGAMAALNSAPIENVVMTDSIYMDIFNDGNSPVEHVSVAPLIAQAIRQINNEQSIFGLVD
jgi:ribose-phosphate pyrophosphokinase